MNTKDKLLNPVWHVHNGNPPKEKFIMTFSMLLNLASSSNADDKKTLWKFINRFHKNISPNNYPMLDSLTNYAIDYFRDKIKPEKKYKKPSNEEKKSLLNLAEAIDSVSQSSSPEDIQTVVYSVGKKNGYEKNLRDWFKLIYKVLFGDNDGPRMGFFISYFGIKETVKLIKDKVN